MFSSCYLALVRLIYQSAGRQKKQPVTPKVHPARAFLVLEPLEQRETPSGMRLATDRALPMRAPALVSVPVIIANGEPGYAEVGSWETNSQPGGYGGTDRYAVVLGSGDNTATWQVGRLAAGQYIVQVCWSTNVSNAS